MATKAKLKPLLPTLKEKKRYLAFEIVSKSKIKAFSSVSKALWGAFLSLFGTRGAAEAGLWVFSEKYNSNSQRGLLKVSHRSLDSSRASLAMVTEIESQPVVVRSLGASGILKKAEKKFIE